MLSRRPGTVLLVAIALILSGGLIAWLTQTAGGRVQITDVRWVAPSGARMSGLLYVPDGATPESPAPGILAVHGYINSRETQAGFAIEFARRGYVVLALDQTGHGYSDPPAFGEGFGGPAGLAYLRSLDFVDRENIGLEGHSMGGWASGMAATVDPDGYRALVLAGSSTGTFGVGEGTPEWPRNLAVIFSRWDEFSPTMWGSPDAANVGQTEKMMNLFGTTEEVREGQLYGSVDEGTARMLHQPSTNHPGEHLSTATIGYAVAWFQRTLEGGEPIAPTDQIWIWKEVGTLIALVGMVLLLFPVGVLLLRSSYFSDIQRSAPLARGARDGGWWLAALVTLALGPLTLFYFKSIPDRVGWTPSALFPQSITNAIITWTTLLAIISLALFAIWHLTTNRGRTGTADAYGLAWDGRVRGGLIARSALLALLIVAAAYIALLVADFLFLIDFRFWVFGVKPMSGLQLRMALVYLIPFTLFFLVLNLVVFGQLRRDEWSARKSTIGVVAILVLGWIALYLVQYVPLVTGGTMAIAAEPLWTIISYQLLPIMLIAALLLTFFNRLTGKIYVGAFATSMLVTWIVVASQATHYAF